MGSGLVFDQHHYTLRLGPLHVLASDAVAYDYG